MVGLRTKDVDRGTLMIFAFCYEYPMSFPNLYKLYKISERYFWTFLEICAPMLKMGIRKALLMRKSVDRMLPYITGEGNLVELTTREENMLELFSWYIEESFSDGESCFSLDQIEQLPFARAYNNKDLCIGTNFRSIKNNLDEITYLDIGGTKFFKTSKPFPLSLFI